MTDYRRAAGRHVTFNPPTPTRTQNGGGVITRDLLLAIGIPGCAIVWGTSAYLNIEFITGYFSLRWQKAFSGGALDEAFVRKRTAPQLYLRADGNRITIDNPNASLQGTKPMHAFCIGKACADRLLDGIEHNNMPEVAP